MIIAAGGCTSISNSGLSVTLQADPPRIFSDSFTTLHIDLDNRQDKSIQNVIVDLFDTGLLTAEKCGRVFPRLLRYEFQSISCSLYAPPIEEESVETEVNTRVYFDNEFSATQVFEIADENEYQRRVAAGTFEVSPGSYVYNDKNVMIEVDFNEPLPLVIRPGKRHFVYFKITNIGDGFISSIQPGDFLVENNNILRCPEIAALYPNGREFPRLACEIVLPPGYFADNRNADFLMRLNYNYELRNSLRIDIIR